MDPFIKSVNISEIFNEFFINIVHNLQIAKINWRNENAEICDDIDSISIAISKFENHPSILKIKESKGEINKFAFKHTTYENVFNKIILLNSSKACPKNTIPAKIIKENQDIFAYKILHDFNYEVDHSTFPAKLKYADITQAHTK